VSLKISKKKSARAIWSLLFPKFENNFRVSKNSEKILNVGNDVLYRHTKSRSEIPYILGLTKMIKSKIMEVCNFACCTTLDVRFCYFVHPKIWVVSS
jgi:hypothetical protein